MKILTATIAVALVASTSYAQTLNGAGATFPAPLYAKWDEESKRDECYPIVSATYILIPADSKNYKNVASWMKWVYKNGDNTAISLDYIPLTVYIKDRVAKQLDR